MRFLALTSLLCILLLCLSFFSAEGKTVPSPTQGSVPEQGLPCQEMEGSPPPHRQSWALEIQAVAPEPV